MRILFLLTVSLGALLAGCGGPASSSTDPNMVKPRDEANSGASDGVSTEIRKIGQVKKN